MGIYPQGIPPTPPTPCWGRPQRGRGGGTWGGVGGKPLWVYFHIGYRTLDTYVYKYTHLLCEKPKLHDFIYLNALLIALLVRNQLK